jgi:hypothetical protein
MCAGAIPRLVAAPKYEPATMPEALVGRSGNVVWLREPSATSRAVARPRPEPKRGLADVVVVGGLLTGLAYSAQQLVLALSLG